VTNLPPSAAPKQLNALLRLYDKPAYRDWAVWITVAMLVITPFALGTGQRASGDTSPRWVDVVFGTPVMTVIFGVLPAYVRLRVRRAARTGVTDQASIDDRDALDQRSQAAIAPTIVQPAPAGKPLAPATVRAQVAAPGLSGVDLASSKNLAFARKSLPYPIARAARTIQIATDRKEQYEALLAAGEAIGICVGLVVAAGFRSLSATSISFQNLQEAFVGRGVTTGHWIALVEAAPSLMKDVPEPIDGLFDGVRPRKGPSLVKDLRSVVEERNLWAHNAGPQSAAEVASRIANLAPIVDDAFGHVQFLANAPWVQIKSCAYRKASADFAVTAFDAMSEHPDFERRDLISTLPMANDTFYMLAKDGPVDLTPFVVIHDCPVCHQSEMCFADRLDPKHGVALKSFGRGHPMFEEQLRADVEHLFGV